MDIRTSENIFMQFTSDMAENLHQYFSTFQEGDVVTLEHNQLGLWFVNPHNGTRQFLGKAKATANNATGVFKTVPFNKIGNGGNNEQH